MSENTLPQSKAYPVIGPAAKFYGYVIGLNVEPGKDAEGRPRRLLATFEDNSAVTSWEVPDLDLWKMLWEHLVGHAYYRHELGEYSSDKVWIEKKESGWHVHLPEGPG